MAALLSELIKRRHLKTSTFLRPLEHQERYTKLLLIYRLCALSRLFSPPSGTQVGNISGRFFGFEIIPEAIRLKGSIPKLYFDYFVRLKNLFQGTGELLKSHLLVSQRGKCCARGRFFGNGSGQQDSLNTGGKGFCRASGGRDRGGAA